MPAKLWAFGLLIAFMNPSGPGGWFDAVARRISKKVDQLEKQRADLEAGDYHDLEVASQGRDYHSLPLKGDESHDIQFQFPAPVDFDRIVIWLAAPRPGRSTVGREDSYAAPGRISVFAQMADQKEARALKVVWKRVGRVWSADIVAKRISRLRFQCSDLSPILGGTSGPYFAVALSEIELWNGNRNLAASGEVSASTEGHYESDALRPANLCDGIRLRPPWRASGRLGYRSSDRPNAESEVKITVELDAEHRLQELRFFPCAPPFDCPPLKSYAMPQSVRVELSYGESFEARLFQDSPTVVPLAGAEAHRFTITFSGLSPDPQRVPPKFYAALAELEIISVAGKNLARSAQFFPSDGVNASPEGDRFSLESIADGDRGGPTLDFARGAQVREIDSDLAVARGQVSMWLTPIVVSVSAALCVCILCWSRRESSAKLKRTRSQIANDLHDEIGGNLGAIRMLSEAVSSEPHPEAIRKDLDRISRLSAETSEALRDIVWLIGDDDMTLQTLVARMRSAAECALVQLKSSVLVESTATSTSRTLQGPYCRNLLMAFKEALHNAVRHANATEVHVLIDVSDTSVRFVVTDNGRGLVNNTKSGRGLKNLEHRARELHGQLMINSTAGAGVSVDFQAPGNR